MYQCYNALMNVSRYLTNSDSIREPASEEFELAKNILTNNLAHQPGSNLFIVTVPEMLQEESALWFETAKKLGSQVKLAVLTDMTHSGEEPPREIIDQVALADTIMFQTVHSLTHTRAGKEVKIQAKRGASLPGADYELIMRTLSIDYTPVKELGEKVKTALQEHETINIFSTAGTKLTAKIRPDLVTNDSGFFAAGEIGNLPAGEVFFPPVLGSANGTVVIDGSIADDILDSPITLEIKDGKITSFKGGTAAAYLEKKLTQFGEGGITMAEIGIGTNKAANISQNLLEAEKAYGTVHIAFGNSSAMGGEIDVPIHIDGLVAEPIIKLDAITILENKIFNLT
ncbi:MAG: 2,5-dihydroxypyridine 5,6-dioxygenase [Patescibacteria group bacterium]|jgi:leucyl aminopeptidase (aminopeptidase T)|nr:2,5-dihydroxypyridine 5,6-dioxygenase [Patescibacteria group bacterium]